MDRRSNDSWDEQAVITKIFLYFYAKPETAGESNKATRPYIGRKKLAKQHALVLYSMQFNEHTSTQRLGNMAEPQNHASAEFLALGVRYDVQERRLPRYSYIFPKHVFLYIYAR